MTANESSKFLFFTLPVPPPFSHKLAGQGGPSLKDAPEFPDGVLRKRLQGDFIIAFHGYQDLSPRLEPDFLPDVGRNNDLAFGQSFNYRHWSFPIGLAVKHNKKAYNDPNIQSTGTSGPTTRRGRIRG
jgi:hypothetical protein